MITTTDITLTNIIMDTITIIMATTITDTRTARHTTRQGIRLKTKKLRRICYKMKRGIKLNTLTSMTKIIIITMITVMATKATSMSMLLSYTS